MVGCLGVMGSCCRWCLKRLLCGFCFLESVSVTKVPWGVFLFFVELKYFKFIIELGEMPSSQEEWNNRRFISCQSFWLLSTVNAVARAENSAGFICKFRDSQSAFLGQRCNNPHRSYMAIEEFNDGGRMGLILIPKARRNGVGVGSWRCCSICCLLIPPWNAHLRSWLYPHQVSVCSR